MSWIRSFVASSGPPSSSSSELSIPTNKIAGRLSPGDGPIEALSVEQVRALVPVAAADVSGLANVAMTGSIADTTGTLPVARLGCTAVGAALINAASTTAQRTALELGSAAVVSASTFAAASHGHVAADVSGVAAASHTHAIGDVSGVAPLVHTHDYAPSSHTHAAGSITGLATIATSGSAADLSGTLAAARVADNSLPAAKLSNLAAAGFLGATAAGPIAQLTPAQAAALLPEASTAAKGLAPVLPNNASLYLNGVGGFTTPAGGSASVSKGTGTSIVCGNDITWLTLAANSADITGVALTTIMAVTGVDVGRYSLRVQLVYQTTALTTGIDVAVNHTGTTTQWLMQHAFASTGGAATTAAAAMNNAAATGATYEAQGSRTKNAVIGAGTVSVDTVNADMLSIIEGVFVVSATGSLEVKLAAEAAALVCRAMQGSNLELRKLS